MSPDDALPNTGEGLGSLCVLQRGEGAGLQGR